MFEFPDNLIWNFDVILSQTAASTNKLLGRANAKKVMEVLNIVPTFYNDYHQL